MSTKDDAETRHQLNLQNLPKFTKIRRCLQKMMQRRVIN